MLTIFEPFQLQCPPYNHRSLKCLSLPVVASLNSTPPNVRLCPLHNAARLTTLFVQLREMSCQRVAQPSAWDHDLSAKPSIDHNILKARKSFFAYGSMGVFQGDLSPLSGRSVVETCILPILFYGAENWCLSHHSLEILDSFLGGDCKRQKRKWRRKWKRKRKWKSVVK